MEKAAEFAVVTGASHGLGKAFAESLSTKGWNLILVALPGTGLPVFAEDLRRLYGSIVFALELDLSTASAQQEFLAFALSDGRPVSLLVNNMGIGDNGLFDRIP